MRRRLSARIAIPGLCTTIMLAFAISLAGRSGTYQATAIFNQAYGIVDGSNVWSGGGIVGSVSAIRLGSDGLPHVTLTISDGYRLRASSTADLQLLSNSGELNRIVMLSQGRGPLLTDGAVIPVSRTSEPVELDDALSTFTPQVRTEIRSVLGQLDGSTRGLSGALRQTLAHSAAALGQTAALLSQVDSDGYALKTLVSQGAIAVHAFAVQQAPLDSTVDGVDRLLQTVANRQTQLRSAVRLLPDGLRAPTLALRSLQGIIPTLSQLTAAITPVADRLGPTSQLLARTLVVAQPGIVELAAVLHEAPAQLRAVLPLLRAALPFSRELTPTLTQLLPILDLLRVYTPEVVGYLGDWGDISTLFNRVGHGIAAAFTPVSPPDRIVPPSSDAPGFLAAPYQRDPGTIVGQPWTDYQTSFLSNRGPK